MSAHARAPKGRQAKHTNITLPTGVSLGLEDSPECTLVDEARKDVHIQYNQGSCNIPC
jgi:hypothetical protein